MPEINLFKRSEKGKEGAKPLHFYLESGNEITIIKDSKHLKDLKQENAYPTDERLRIIDIFDD